MSSAMVGNGYQQNYNTYNGQLDPNHGQNMQEGYYEPHPSSRPPANEQQYYRSPPPQPQSVQTSPRRGVFYRLVSPEVGLPLGRYEEQRKSFDDQRQRDYFTMMSQKEQNPSPRRKPNTPPHGLDIVSQSERTRQAKEKQRLYGQELQKENPAPDIFLESYRKKPVEDWNRGKRNQEYNEFLGKKEAQEQSKREQLEKLRRQPAVQPKYDNYSNSDNHERHRKNLDSELRDQYQSFLSKNHSREEPSQEYGRKVPQMGLPLDNTKSNAMRRQQEKDRNQDYNKFLDEKKRSPRRYHQPTPEDKQGLPLTQRPYDEKKALSEKQRNLEYNQFLAKNHTRYWNMINEKKKGEVPRRQRDPSLDEKNMFSDMGKSQDAHNRKVKEDARQDYRNYVNHAFPEGLNRGEPTFAARKAPPESWYDAQPPTHRHSPPRDYRPEPEHFQRQSHDAYAERLEQARANEALYRKRDHQMNDSGYRQPPPRQDQAPYALH